MRYFFTFLVLLFIQVPSLRAEEQKPIDPMGRLRSEVQRIELSNGIRVLFFRRAVAPVFAGETWVKVGGVEEQVGATGLAHFLEHMAFKGTTTVGTKDYKREKELLDQLDAIVVKSGDSAAKQQEGLASEEATKIIKELDTLWIDNEFGKIYSRAGAVGLNAATSKDYTMYTVELPSVAFEMWCQLESERLKNPVFRQFYREREVVLEERRRSYDDNPSGRLYEALLQVAYLRHPYRYPLIGWKEDVARLSAKQMKEFYEAHYYPKNIVIGLVGDLDPAVVRSLTEKYFGSFQAKAPPEIPREIVEDPQDGPRAVTVEYDAEPQFLLGYHKPAYPHPDDAKFAVLHAVLADGRSAIFEKELVREKKLASSVFTTEAPGERYPSLFVAGGEPNHGVTNERLAEEVEKIFARLQKELLPAELIESAKRRVKVDLLRSLDSNGGLASALAKSELFWNRWSEFLDVYEEIERTTPEDVRRLAQTYLRPELRTFARLVKKESAAK